MGMSGEGGKDTFNKPLASHIIYTKLLYSSRYFRADTFQEKSWAMA
jgi:hypothetical protein